MNAHRRRTLRKWSKRFEVLRLELQIIAEDEIVSFERLPANLQWSRGEVIDANANALDDIQNELTELRGRVDEIVNK